MAEITSLNRVVEVIGNEVIINETTKTVMKKIDLEGKLGEVGVRIKRIKETNARIMEEYEALLAEETETKNLIAQLPVEAPIKAI